ncbi:hypothetical protein AM493_12185 [Flavobacterium akiainvivens]|uniref:Outer membrane protein beta-barrel domain-containing protein n=1 Tax=Flavobacterium akiainvivens TaxID=1202724 RepID=A0A0M8MBL6_9FLAO|nr:hypothetical protein [Flavobacterium akiainvivens]KOS06705.1 hypothetical protein AM493_12185 [Flavobacterium akiainvivens]SFQ71098.1 hypothetical protein SAMN05444144_11679 [Flavobacterium akiainvivens]
MKHTALLLLFISFGTFAQNRTAYIIKNDNINKPVNFKKSSFWDDFEGFNQFTLSTPLRLNPQYGDTNNSSRNSITRYLPDGLSAHGGMGWHINQNFTLTANTGFDWHIDAGLFSVPVYASALLNININNENSILLQYGYGHAFTIGHGDLSGTYQKFRLGYCMDILGIFAELNNYGYPWKDAPTMASINLGVSVFVFR